MLHVSSSITFQSHDWANFGILIKRFHALHCGLRTKPERACRIVTACAILHNIGIQRRDILRDSDLTNAVDVAMDVHVRVPEDAVGRTVRDHVRDTYFLWVRSMQSQHLRILIIKLQFTIYYFMYRYLIHITNMVNWLMNNYNNNECQDISLTTNKYNNWC